MERPVSAASATTTTTATHKRTKSAPRLPPGPVLSSLFLTNLRLLNLDRLAGWPSISPFTFTNVDARARIKAVEWSLYQLFRLYDPALAAERLQPFFPPLEPLQSINLRAALYRCLDGLKKNGALGREAVLRKTMLDECAGDKFWEVCVAFSAVVVRKRAVGKRGKSGLGRPVAQTLATAPGLGKADREALLPLLVAHRVSLSRNLSEKQRLGEEFAQLGNLLQEKEDDLGRRKADLYRHGKIEQTEKQLDHFKPLEDVLRKGWVGDEGFEEAVLSGGNPSSGDRMMMELTEALFNRDQNSTESIESQDNRSLVEEIATKARGQNLRLKRWQALYDKLQAAKPKLSQAEEARVKINSTTARFDRHADLTLADTRSQRGSVSPTKGTHLRAASACVTGYDNILAAMREDLRLTQNARRNNDGAPQDVRHNRSASDAITGASRTSSYHNSRSRQHSRSPSLQYSPSQSPAPFRPGMPRRISSRSRSYQQPKVISQRGPIPLKTELFSPLKSARPGCESPNSAFVSRPPSRLSSPQEEVDESAASIDAAMGNYDQMSASRGRESRRGTPSLPSPKKEQVESVASLDGALAGLGLRDVHQSGDFDSASTVESALNFALPAQSASPVNLDPPKQDPLADTTEFKKPALPLSRRPTLAERTRLSMAFKSSEDNRSLISGSHSPVEPPSPAITNDQFPLPPSGMAQSPPPDSAPPALSLADRARQSISSFQPPSPVPASRSRPPQHARSRTSVHQQPLTTPKARRSSFGHLAVSHEDDGEQEDGQTPDGSRRVVTPRDQLFEASAEYDSVFKSRPRVMYSPVVSPSVMDQDEDESMIGALKGLEDDDALGSSPLRR